MLIKLVVRVNKIKIEGASRAHLTKREFILFDNCEMVRYGDPVEVDLAGFKQVYPTLETVKTRDQQIAWDDDIIVYFHYMLKDPELCYEDEKYHYNTIEWKDSKTNKWHRLIFDTYAFLQNDSGRTIEKLKG